MAAQSTNPADHYDEKLVAIGRSVIEISPIPMAIVEGFDHILRCVNRPFCTLVGRQREQLLGRSISSSIGAGRAFQSRLDRVYASGESQVQTTESPEEAATPLSAYAMWPILNATNAPIGVMIQMTGHGPVKDRERGRGSAIREAFPFGSQRQFITENLTERLRIETLERGKAMEALAKSEKLASLGRMAASIAHEINNPLEAVTNVIYLARSVPDLPEDACQYLDMADAELSRIAHITRQTLGFYRETPKTNIFSVASLLESVSELLLSKIEGSRVTVEWDVDKRLQICADFGELRQVFANLILNSLDAMGDGGKLRLRVRSRRESGVGAHLAQITVSDSGGGIEPATLPHIFEPFFTTKGSTGNGLGLWVSRQIIQKHGGNIRARSSTHGNHRGTTFLVSLPEVVA